ncbi:MAG: DUF3990 domain-containing protein [Dysgonamonadaceae bacterium]|jgi:hypothetical protein|nr:DUF3990 domain-containing protein [Dysgonamonadaceae bacterium]
MQLYHGSNQIIRQPDLSKGRKYLDFGNGFYLSNEKGQAENRAKSAVLFFEDGTPTVNIYNWENTNNDLKILNFPSANIEWLDFVLANRMGNVSEPTAQYDIVSGPTANDKTILVIDQFMAGMFDNLENPKEFVIQLFQPEKLATQYLFATPKSLDYLKFINSYTL